VYGFLQLRHESKWVILNAELCDDDCILDARNEPAIPAPDVWIEGNLAKIEFPKGDLALPQHNLIFHEELSGFTMTKGISPR
jgi:hypothetical protein